MEDKIKGDMTKAEGKVKEEFGKLTNDPLTQAGGKIDQLTGSIQKKAGEIEEDAQKDEHIDEPASR